MIGPNELTPPPSEPGWKLFLKELVAPLNLMLICASLMCILVRASGIQFVCLSVATFGEGRQGYGSGRAGLFAVGTLFVDTVERRRGRRSTTDCCLFQRVL